MKQKMKVVGLFQKLMKLPPEKRAEVMAKVKLKRKEKMEEKGVQDEAQKLTRFIADEIWQPQHPQAKAQQDLDNSMSELGKILARGNRMQMMPVHEAALLTVLTQVMDSSFHLNLYKFKDIARFVMGTIRKNFGDKATDTITIDHLQGAYIFIAGKYKQQGASTKNEVLAIESLEELEENFPQSGTATEMQISKSEQPKMKHSNWISQARAHWKEFQPTRYKRLVAEGILNQQLTDAAEATSQEMQRLVGQGFNQYEAWEMSRELYLFPAEEAGVSEEAQVSEGLKAMREMNESLRYLGMTDEEIAIEKSLAE